jgi:hypothetical protein
LSLDTPTSETDAACLLEQFAEFLRDGLPDGAALRVDAPHPCVVAVPRPTLVGMLSNAIDSALYNMHEAGSRGQILLRAVKMDTHTMIVQVTDDGDAAARLLEANTKDPSFSDSRAVRLRHLRKRARRAGGEMTLVSGAEGNVLSLYLPLARDAAVQAQPDEPPPSSTRRRRRVGPQIDGVSPAAASGRRLEPRNS